MTNLLKSAFALAALGLAIAPAQAQDAAGKVVFGANLGIGAFAAVLDPATLEFCYKLEVPGLGEAATAAHIHQHENGRPTLPLKTPVDGVSEGCATLDPGFGAAVQANPAGYYVNVHTASAPAGKAQGDLALVETE